MHYKIGSRGSQLALIQSESVKARIAAAYPADSFEIVVLSSRGDRDPTKPLEALGAGAFVRDLEDRLLAGEVDLLVHSMKDLPAVEPEGLVLAQAWTRADPRDALVSREGKTLDELPRGAVVATGSVRRTHFLRQRRPDLKFVPIRGNVDTRLRKLFAAKDGLEGADRSERGPYRIDALVLACAGLDRLRCSEVITERLDPTWMIPAPNQGQLAIEIRVGDAELKQKIDALGDAAAERIAQAERAFLRSTGATCRDAVAAYATLEKGELHLMSFFEKTEPPKVTLVGAGPGDPDLITLKGLKAIRAAEAIVYDRLVSKELLAEASPVCELHDVGKTPSSTSTSTLNLHAVSQSDINALLVDLASRHRRIVRLKGGDAFVFGRGGEEIAYLREHGIACETIPGVTSAVAVPEAAGIPVTHRGVATSFRVITAHGANFSAADLDYASMRDPKTTLVFLMGFAQLAEIASGLIAAGRAPSTPAAVIANGTTAAQREVRGPLETIAEAAMTAGLAAPAILVVGDVVAFGRRCLVAKVGDSPSALADRLRAAGADVTEVPVGRIRPLPGAVTAAQFAAADWLVATSANALRTLDADLSVSATKPKVAAIGPTTAAAAEALGFSVALIASAANSATLLRELSAVVRPTDAVLRLLPEGVSDSLVALSERCHYAAVACYVNEPVDVPPVERSAYDELYWTSPSCRRRVGGGDMV